MVFGLLVSVNTNHFGYCMSQVISPLIELIREWIMSPVNESAGLHLSILEVFHVIEEMIAEHVANPETSRLKKYLPKIKKIFLPLDLRKAAAEVG